MKPTSGRKQEAPAQPQPAPQKPAVDLSKPLEGWNESTPVEKDTIEETTKEE